MNHVRFRVLPAIVLFGAGCASDPQSTGPGRAPASVPAPGPLRVSAQNPRYFADGTGKIHYLTGSHTWKNFATDGGTADPPIAFDYDRYLDFLTAHNHNFFRG